VTYLRRKRVKFYPTPAEDPPKDSSRLTPGVRLHLPTTHPAEISLRPSTRRLRRFGACLTTLVATLALGSTAQAAAPGLNVAHPDQARIAEALDTNAKLIRFFVEWKTLQPTKGDRYPSTDPGAGNLAREFDAAISQVVAGGAQPLFVVLGTPEWANGSSDQFVPPTDPQDYADFMAQFVRHTKAVAAKGGGDIAGYEIWNEQDDKIFWHDANPGDATRYTALLKATYATAKPAAGSTPILVGPTTGNNADYVAQLYAKGAKDSFDGLSVHTDTACLTNGPDFYVRDSERGDRINQYSFLGYRAVRDVMLANSDGGKGIWMSELGWSSTGGVAGTCDPSRIPNAGSRSDGVTEVNQAAFLTQAYGCMAQDKYLKAAFWFTMFDDAGQPLNENRHYGLIRRDGTRKPSYDAFKAVVAGGGSAGAPCGDFVAPAISVLAPTPGFGFTGRLLIRASATDQADPGVAPVGLLRLTFKVDDQAQAIGNYGPSTGVKDGVVVEQDYFGALKLADGKHKITIQARDANGNVSSSSVDVCKGTSCIKTSYATKIVLAKGKQPKCKGLSCSVSGRLTGPAGMSLSGRVRVEWQRFVRMRVKSTVPGKKRYVSKWVTYHKGGSAAGKPFVFKQKLKATGKWRVRVTYDGALPLKGTALAYTTFRR
jgi:hypothetical protein